MTPDGGLEVFRPADNGWESFFRIEKEDTITTNTLGFNETNDIICMKDSRGRNTLHSMPWT